LEKADKELEKVMKKVTSNPPEAMVEASANQNLIK